MEEKEEHEDMLGYRQGLRKYILTVYFEKKKKPFPARIPKPRAKALVPAAQTL